MNIVALRGSWCLLVFANTRTLAQAESFYQKGSDLDSSGLGFIIDQISTQNLESPLQTPSSQAERIPITESCSQAWC
ncbi:hypothetical protein BJ508DRAFT_61934 [Ascobolus immersus RN42]|uniref:Uncharacterized protein n=1 Tax=Ascobolus immersus RN42 TaxID=1160509 RepID=A0A3N4IN50_ASCIM|nr:hypothetical protein BJ508DRAFT_61934 [Ascobolus immersus RN42]